MAQKLHEGYTHPPSNAISTTYSKTRYAHPFYLPTLPHEREPIDGHTRITDWSKQQLGPLPPVKRGGVMQLAEAIGDEGVKEIESTGELRFHALGDSGVGTAHEAQEVSDQMAGDFKAGAGGLNPGFLFHLGDVIYGNDKADHYGERFYVPYKHYPGKIFAIPGNHDGEVRAAADSPSLSAFLSNFCADKAAVPVQASTGGIYRETMTQPGEYFMLEAPFVRIIGLYSNLLENPGFLDGITNGQSDHSQLDWLAKTLTSIAKNKDKKALVITTHHPPFSQSGHSGSTEMDASITDACTKVGVFPDLFLSAHAHNYQRYTRRLSGRQIPYLVVGTGGMPPQPVKTATGQIADAGRQVTYDAALSSLGYLLVAVTGTRLSAAFWPLGENVIKAYDTFSVDLVNHVVGK